MLLLAGTTHNTQFRKMRLLSWTICSLVYVVITTDALALPRGMEKFLPLEVDLDRDTRTAADGIGQVEDVHCGYFIKHEEKSLYGWNTKKVENVAISECWKLCAKERSFYCRSVDFNEDSSSSGDTTSCYLSSESHVTQSQDYGTNFNTDYYERVCNVTSVPSGSGDGQSIEF